MLKAVKIKRVSLRTRIFLSMILLTFLASLLMAGISIFQFKTEAKNYHQERLERKENAIKEHINYILSTTTYPLTTDNLPLIFKDKIHELADIHSLLNYLQDNLQRMRMSQERLEIRDFLMKRIRKL